MAALYRESGLSRSAGQGRERGLACIALGMVLLALTLISCAPEPTPTPDFNAGWKIMQAMPCDQLIRYAEAAILRAEAEGGWTYSDDGMVDLTLLIHRAEGIEDYATITIFDVSDRLEECE